MYCLFFLLFPSFLSSHSDKIITKEIFTESESSEPKTTFYFSSQLIPEKCLLNTFSQMSSIPIHHYLSNLNQTKFISNVTTFPQFNKCIQYEDDLIIEKRQLYQILIFIQLNVTMTISQVLAQDCHINLTMKNSLQYIYCMMEKESNINHSVFILLEIMKRFTLEEFPRKNICVITIKAIAMLITHKAIGDVHYIEFNTEFII